MSQMQKTKLKLDHNFDTESCRHFLNNEPYVLHCHHYASLYSQLADDCSMVDAKKMLSEVSEDSFYEELSNYFGENNIEDTAERISLAEQYFATTGLGQLNVSCAGIAGGEAEMRHSHVDEGWIKKWGKRDKPVNFIGQGFVAALFSAVFNRPRRSYVVVETESIVKGDECSKFKAVSM